MTTSRGGGFNNRGVIVGLCVGQVLLGGGGWSRCHVTHRKWIYIHTFSRAALLLLKNKIIILPMFRSFQRVWILTSRTGARTSELYIYIYIYTHI